MERTPGAVDDRSRTERATSLSLLCASSSSRPASLTVSARLSLCAAPPAAAHRAPLAVKQEPQEQRGGMEECSSRRRRDSDRDGHHAANRMPAQRARPDESARKEQVSDTSAGSAASTPLLFLVFFVSFALGAFIEKRSRRS